ncbi:MAG TPA: energy transducer TonB [Stenotrophomonas sp.]|jgi:protein TonB
MVRTQSPQYGFRIDSARVLALSTAIALHVLAACLLLIPLSRHATPDAPVPPTPRWQMPVLVPPPPVPPVPIDSHPLPTPPMAPTAPVVPTTPLPPLVDAVAHQVASVEPVPTLPSTDSVAPVADSVAPPRAGASLRYLQAPPPAYPRAAIASRQEGTVLLQVRVGRDGMPMEVVVARSSGSRVLDQAARMQVLKHWRFQPALQDGQAVEALGLVPVDFSLAN